MKNIKTYLLVLVFLITPSTVNAASNPEHQREPWYIGFGIGFGTVLQSSMEVDGEKIDLKDWAKGDRIPNMLFNFKVGYTVNRNLLVGFDTGFINQLSVEDTPTGDIIRFAQINNYYAMATYFPMGSGFFLRGGGGFSRMVRYIWYDDDDVRDDYDDSVSGYGLSAGLGYSLWLGRTFNLSVYLDHSRQNYNANDNEPDKSQFTAMYLGFDWY